MIKLTIDSQVLTKLQQAFPSPANSASRALNKYVTALEGLLLNAVQRGIAPAQRKLPDAIDLDVRAGKDVRLRFNRQQVEDAWDGVTDAFTKAMIQEAFYRLIR